MSDTDRADDRPRRIGRYEVLDLLGRGGMAVVYLARQLDLDRFVALKELNAPLAADPGGVHRFVREAKLAATLKHPSIVTVYETLEWEGLPYLSMEYVERGPLRPLIGRMTFPQIAGALQAVLAGLAHAERHGIVHRDLKPENLLVTADGALKVADFGIAKAIDRVATASGFATRTGAMIGTPAYMAPEQANSQDVGPGADLYATGIVAYEMVSGRVPFEGGHLLVLTRQANEPVPRAEPLADDVPPEALDWIARMVEKDPADRFATAAEASDALEDVVLNAYGPRWRRLARLVDGDDTLPLTPPRFERESFAWPDPWESGRSSAATPTGDHVAPAPERRRPSLRAIAAGALIAAAAALGVVLASRPDEPPPAVAVESASTEDLQLRFNAPWRRADTATALGLEPGVTLARSGTPGLLVHAVRTGASGPALVPDSMSRRLARPAGGGERIKLGAYEAVRHRGLQVDGLAGTVTLFGIPASNGVMTVACVLPNTSDAVSAECDRVAASVRVRRGDPYPVGPRREYGDGVDAALRALAPARRKALDALRSARTPKRQAAAAADAGRAFAATRKRLARLAVSPVDALAHRQIVGAAARAAAAYGRMATAASARRRRAFDTARRLALSGESAFAAAIGSLASLGYEVAS